MGDRNQKEDGSGRFLKNLVQRTGRFLAAANADREGENENRPNSQNPIFVARLNFRHRTKKVTGSATNCYLWFENRCAQWRNGPPKCRVRRHASPIWELRNHLTIATGVRASYAVRPRVANKVNLASGRGEASPRHVRSVIPGEVGKDLPTSGDL